jgi:hypothetical protein
MSDSRQFPISTLNQREELGVYIGSLLENLKLKTLHDKEFFGIVELGIYAPLPEVFPKTIFESKVSGYSKENYEQLVRTFDSFYATHKSLMELSDAYNKRDSLTLRNALADKFVHAHFIDPETESYDLEELTKNASLSKPQLMKVVLNGIHENFYNSLNSVLAENGERLYSFDGMVRKIVDQNDLPACKGREGTYSALMAAKEKAVVIKYDLRKV